MVAGDVNHPDGMPTKPGAHFPIPPGYGKPGYHPESKVVPHVVVITFLTVIMLVTVVLRIYTRLALVRSFGWDDGLIIAAAVTAVGMIALYGLLYKAGMGKHLIDTPIVKGGPKVFTRLAYYGFPAYHLHTFTVYFIKMSILAFLHRIVSMGKTVYLIYSLYVIVTAFMISCFCLVLFQCNPIKAFWSKPFLAPGSYTCQPFERILYFVNISNAVIDVIIFLVPIPTILKVQLRKKEKIIVVGLFLIGGIATIAAIVRAVLTVTHGNDLDTTWAGADLLLAATIEVLLSIICCSVPALKKLATQVFGMKGTTTQYASHTANSMPLTRRKTSLIYPASSESTEEFRPEFTPLEHKYASPHNNRVTVEAVSRDALDVDDEMQPPSGHIAVRTDFRQTTCIVVKNGVRV